MRYVLGVEGDNSNTRYFLFDETGAIVDVLHDGTSTPGMLGLEDAADVLGARIRQLLRGQHLGVSDLATGVFGLAGIDNKEGSEQIRSHMQQVGIARCAVYNDTYLGIMAGTTQGIGVCTVNASGCATGGIDEEGDWLQVGGIGALTGDVGGGYHIAEQCMRTVYDHLFRCGAPTMMTEPVLALLDISDPRTLLDAMIRRWPNMVDLHEMNRIAFAAAEMDDAPALSILQESGRELARSTAGCIRSLCFSKRVEVVLMGGGWVYAENPTLNNAYEEELQRLSPKEVSTRILQVPAAVGAVLSAFELMGRDCFEPTLRRRIEEQVAVRVSRMSEVAW